MLEALYNVLHSMFTKSLQINDCYFYFMDEETETQGA